ncbi:MAG: cytochrome c [Candidatus Competibacteraceae bacterium]|nr:cytochrome c [Candidatus Competibacteraceae bacterium]
MRKQFAMVLAGGILGAGILATGYAAEGKPEDTVKYRQSLYNIIGWNFKPMGAMAKGEIPFDATAVARHAQYVEMMSKALPESFAQGTGPDAVKNTEAKPEIWTKTAEFDTKMKDFQREAAALNEVAKSGDEKAIKAQFGKTAETCKACHKAFRKD